MTSEQKWTPGPWSASGDVHAVASSDGGSETMEYCGAVFTSSEGPYRGTICHVQSAVVIGGISAEEAQTNATLLAASQDLYAALADLYAEVCEIPGGDLSNKVHLALANAFDALLKARGEQK